MSTPEPRYPYVVVDVDPDAVDEVSTWLFELGAAGVEERDVTTLARETVVGKVTLVASFADRGDALAAISELDGALTPRLEEVVGDAWKDAWKAHFAPFRLSPHVTIRPPWEPHERASADEVVLELEPGRAFGTGLHATTSLLARYLDEHRAELAGAPVLDVGTGSGILALVALAFGAAKVVATDIDPEAVAVARENAERNGYASRLDASTTPLESVGGRFPWVLANIEARVLTPMASALVARVAPGGALLLSGILEGQEDDIARAYGAMRCEVIRSEGEWRAMVMRAPGSLASA